MSSRTRHWKQRWDPSAPLVFARRLRMGSNPSKPFVLPGDKVTKKHRELLGNNRLKMWFENGTLQLADFTPPDEQRRLAIVERKKREQMEAKIEAERLALIKAEEESERVNDAEEPEASNDQPEAE